MENHYELVSAMDACADRLEYLNQLFPKLATPTTMDGVMHWRQSRIQLPDHDSGDSAEYEKQPRVDIREVAISLLQQYSLEDVLELLMENHRVGVSLPELIQLIGKQQYLGVLKRDVSELLKNAISLEQIATLWNDLERPAFGGPAWNSRSISMLSI
jgi:hypothetical protein